MFRSGKQTGSTHVGNETLLACDDIGLRLGSPETRFVFILYLRQRVLEVCLSRAWCCMGICHCFSVTFASEFPLSAMFRTRSVVFVHAVVRLVSALRIPLQSSS